MSLGIQYISRADTFCLIPSTLVRKGVHKIYQSTNRRHETVLTGAHLFILHLMSSQHHPVVAASLPVTAGVLSIAGLSFLFGPFSLAALAFFIPATDSVLKSQMHKDTKVLRELKRVPHQMKRMSQRADAEGLRKTLEYAASTDDPRTIARIELERREELGIDME